MFEASKIQNELAARYNAVAKQSNLPSKARLVVENNKLSHANKPLLTTFVSSILQNRELTNEQKDAALAYASTIVNSNVSDQEIFKQLNEANFLQNAMRYVGQGIHKLTGNTAGARNAANEHAASDFYAKLKTLTQQSKSLAAILNDPAFLKDWDIVHSRGPGGQINNFFDTTFRDMAGANRSDNAGAWINDLQSSLMAMKNAVGAKGIITKILGELQSANSLHAGVGAQAGQGKDYTRAGDTQRIDTARSQAGQANRNAQGAQQTAQTAQRTAQGAANDATAAADLAGEVQQQQNAPQYHQMDDDQLKAHEDQIAKAKAARAAQNNPASA